jgi:hypothetical protein
MQMARLTNEIMDSLLPQFLPAPILSFQHLEIITGRLAVLDPARQRALAWSGILQEEAERTELHLRYAGFRFATFGFIPVMERAPPPLLSVGGYVFGTAIERGPVNQSTTPSQIIEAQEIAGQSFALVLNRRQFFLDVANPVHPRPGTGACWAKSNRTMLAGVSPDGILTAEHVISGTALGGNVTAALPGSSSTTWQLADCGDCKIDAALITQSGSIPSAAKKLSVQTSPSPGTDVEILGNASPNPTTGKITHTMIFPTYLSELNPMRVFLDVHGIGGDSGALVRETPKGAAVGIYMGQTAATHTAPGGGTVEGICQYLEQARAALDVDLSL